MGYLVMLAFHKGKEKSLQNFEVRSIILMQKLEGDSEISETSVILTERRKTITANI